MTFDLYWSLAVCLTRERDAGQSQSKSTWSEKEQWYPETSLNKPSTPLRVRTAAPG